MQVLVLSAEEPAVVGDPAAPAKLPQAIYDAHQQGAKEITIRPGTYHLPAMPTGDTVVLDKWIGTTIHAPGVVFVCENLKHSALLFRECRDVCWEGGTIGYVRPAMTQGHVKAIGSDAQGSTCDWQIDPGYPVGVDPVKSTYDVVDAASRLLKVGTGDWTPKSAEVLAQPGLFRLHYQDKPSFAVNDWLVTRAQGGNLTAHLDGCGNCTLENVTFYNGGFANFFETGGPGGNHYLKCRIQAGPRPEGATEDEIVSCGADGFHSTGTARGPDIEDCVFTGVFLDDCIAIHGGFGRVIGTDGNSIILRRGGGNPVVGSPLRISDTHGFFGQATVTALQKTASGDVQVTLDQDLHVPIDHSQDQQEKLGTKANNPDFCGRGYQILRCRLGDTRSRGILVKADDGIIRGCTIEGCGMSGVSIGPEFWWGEANYCWNVDVSDNTFRTCSKNNGDQGAVWVHGDGAMGNRGITVRNNVLDTCYGQYVFRIEDTDGIQIVGNQVVKPFTVKTASPGNVLWVKQSRNVALQGDEVRDEGGFAGETVHLEPGMHESDLRTGAGGGIVVDSGRP